MDGYIIKPIGLSHLIECLTLLMGKSTKVTLAARLT
jgi:hypothetical protein